MNILLTGGAGFLGLQTCHYLNLDEASGNDNPNEAIVLDRQECPRGYLESHGETFTDSTRLRFEEGDVCDLDTVQRLVEQVDVIIHLASIVGGPACDKAPDRARRIALNGMETVIKAAQGKMIVFASSDVVYGKGAEGSCGEDTPGNPVTLYAELKLQCEVMLRANPQYCILRIPSSFGVCSGAPSVMKWDVLVNCLCQSMHEKGAISIAEPEAIRALIHSWDAARAFRFVLDNQDSCSGKTLNIASGAWTRREMGEIIAEVFGGDVNFADTGTDPERHGFTLDCSAINRLGWYPAFNLEHGIKLVKRSLSVLSAERKKG